MKHYFASGNQEGKSRVSSVSYNHQDQEKEFKEKEISKPLNGTTLSQNNLSL